VQYVIYALSVIACPPR